MAYCSNCGTPIIDTVKFCPECGAPVISASDTMTRQADSQQRQNNSDAYTNSTQNREPQQNQYSSQEQYSNQNQNQYANQNQYSNQNQYANQNQYTNQNQFYDQSVQGPVSTKSRLVALLLAIFLGGFGIHRFYLGHTSSAIGMIALCVIGIITTAVVVGIILLIILGIWVLIDIIKIAIGTFNDKNGLPVKIWLTND